MEISGRVQIRRKEANKRNQQNNSGTIEEY